MRQWCRENNNPDPQFEHRGGAFVTIFYKSGGVNNILVLIKEDQGINSKNIAETLDVAPRTIERHIKKLRDDGLIEYRGSSKTRGYYFL